jgi:hypothetical protein
MMLLRKPLNQSQFRCFFTLTVSFDDTPATLSSDQFITKDWLSSLLSHIFVDVKPSRLIGIS